jgi:hypothetical protein
VTPDRRVLLVAAAVSLAVSAAFLAAMLLGTGGRLSLPLDDAFIFFQYAREFAAGRPFVYNAGDPASGGATSVVTLLLDTLGWLVGFRGDGMILFALLSGTVGLSLSLTAAWRLGRALGFERPLWAPLFVGLNGPLLWGLHAGMDLPLYVAGILWTLASWAEERVRGAGRRRTLTWGALAAASRPEGLTFGVLLSLLLAAEALAGRFGAGSGRGASEADSASGARGGPAPANLPPEPGPDTARPRFGPALLVPIAAALVPMLLLFLFTGRPTPTSLLVKGAVGLPGVDAGTWLGGALEYFVSILREIYLGFDGEKPTRLQGNNASGVLFYLVPLTFLLYLVGLLPGIAREIAARRPGPFALAAAALFVSLVSASLIVPRTWHWHRYLIPTYALVLPFAALGLERVGRGLGRMAPGTPARPLAGAVLAAWLVLALPGPLYFLLAFAQNSADIAFQQRALGFWIRDQLPAGSLVAVNDAGALRYDGGHPILDLEGLTTPWLAEEKREGTSSLWEALERLPAERRPTHLVVYPSWYDPAFVKPHRAIHQRRIHRQTIAGGNPMIVYEADWSLLNSGDALSEPSLAGMTAGLRLVDRLDVADRHNERRHDYVHRAVEGQYQGLLEMAPGDDGRSLMDGGRLISRDETFTIRGLTPGRDLLVVLRSRNGFRVRLTAGDEDAGEWLEPGRAGNSWVESSYRVPGALIRAPELRLRVAVAEEHATAYTAFHYWFYQ